MGKREDLRLCDQIREVVYNEIREISPLSEEEKQAINTRIQAGDSSARQELADRSLRLALSIVHAYDWSGVSVDDLFQSAVLGLIRASREYDPSRGIQFSTYATGAIKRAIWRELQNSGRSVHIPPKYRTDIARYTKYTESFFKQNGREPTDEEAASALLLETEDIQELRIIMQTEISFDQPIAEDNDGDELTLADITPGEGDIADAVIESAEQEALNRILCQCVGELPEAERTLISEVYLHGRSLKAWAAQTGKGMHTARKLRRHALDLLRHSSLGDLIQRRDLILRRELIDSYAYKTSFGAWKDHNETSATEYTVLKLIENGV